MIGFFKKKNNPNIMDKATKNFINSQKRSAKALIGLLDTRIENDSRRGSYGTHLYYNRYDLVVRNECLDIVEKHYKDLGFKVEIKRPSNTSSSTQYDTIDIWWDHLESE